jgi:hypothetical protein
VRRCGLALRQAQGEAEWQASATPHPAFANAKAAFSRKGRRKGTEGAAQARNLGTTSFSATSSLAPDRRHLISTLPSARLLGPTIT